MSGNRPTQPSVGVGAVVINNNKVLLVLRGQPPAKGFWSIPGGKVEPGETLKQAVERELAEECGVTVRVTSPVAVVDSIHVDDEGQIKHHYVLVDFWAEYISGELTPASDAADARWVALEDIHQYELTSGTLELFQHLGLLADGPPGDIVQKGLLYRTIWRKDVS